MDYVILAVCLVVLWRVVLGERWFCSFYFPRIGEGILFLESGTTITTSLLKIIVLFIFEKAINYLIFGQILKD